MTKERYEEIALEVNRRLNLWLDNTTFEKMTVGYSKLRFEMAIGLGGYPFEKESWMDKDDFNPFVTDEEFCHPMCDYIIGSMFNNLMKHTDEI